MTPEQKRRAVQRQLVEDLVNAALAVARLPIDPRAALKRLDTARSRVMEQMK